MKWLKKEFKRANSYRDPDLSDRWLSEAMFHAEHETWMHPDRSAKIIIRLVEEVRRLNRMTGRSNW